MISLIEVAEKIANDPKLPSGLVDWAVQQYDLLNDKNASIRVEDVNLLCFAHGDNMAQGLYLIDHYLANREKNHETNNQSI